MTALHPAAGAWLKLHPDADPPEIEPVLETHAGDKIKEGKISKLLFADDSRVLVAKARNARTIRFEAHVYSHVLSHLPVRTPEYFGHVLDEETDSGWLFLEHVPGPKQKNWTPKIRREASLWIAKFHRLSARHRHGSILPDRGSTFVYSNFERVQARLESRSAPPVFSEAAACTRTWLQHFQTYVQAASSLPPTVVHGDLVLKNIRATPSDRPYGLVVLDWETAGRAEPAVDLAFLDPVAYREGLADFGCMVSEPDVRSMFAVGRVFRAIRGLGWQLAYWPAAWSREAETNLRVHVARGNRAHLELVRGRGVVSM